MCLSLHHATKLRLTSYSEISHGHAHMPTKKIGIHFYTKILYIAGFKISFVNGAISSCCKVLFTLGYILAMPLFLDMCLFYFSKHVTLYKSRPSCKFLQ